MFLHNCERIWHFETVLHSSCKMVSMLWFKCVLFLLWNYDLCQHYLTLIILLFSKWFLITDNLSFLLFFLPCTHPPSLCTLPIVPNSKHNTLQTTPIPANRIFSPADEHWEKELEAELQDFELVDDEHHAGGTATSAADWEKDVDDLLGDCEDLK